MRLKRSIAAVALALLASAGCGDDDSSAPEPTATHEITGRILGPGDDAKNTVDELNDLQEQKENSYP